MLKDRAILTLAVTQTLVWGGLFYVFPALLLRWEADLGWSRADLAFAIMLATLAAALSAPLAGRLIDRGLGPMLMGLTPAVGGICLIALSQITTLWQFYALWLVIGVMQAGSLYEPCFALVTHSRGAKAKQGIVVITLVAGFAGTISFPTMHVLSETYGWRAACVVVGLGITLLIAPLQGLAARSLQSGRIASPKRPATEAKPKSFLRRPTFWLLGVSLSTLAFVHGITLNHLLPLLNERGFQPEFAVLIAALIGPMQVAGRLVMVATQRFVDHRQFMLVTFGGIALAITVLLITGDSRTLAVVFVLIYGSAWGTTSILRPVIARDILGEDNFGAKSGSLALIFLTATASSAYLGAVIWGISGYGTLLAGLIGLAICGAALYLLAHRLSDAEQKASG